MRRLLKIVGLVIALPLAVAVLGGALFALRVWSREPPRVAVSTTHAALSRQDCIDCHAPIAEEWRQSYHYRSLSGPYWRDVRQLGYAKVFDRTRKSCVNCHAPANVLDLVDSMPARRAPSDPLGVECTPNLLREPRGTIPAARAGDVELGVDCTSCHVSARGIVGAGLRHAAAHETLADPRFQDPALTVDTLCRICHGATVEAWKRTTLPAAGVTCLDCHMPEIDAASVSAGAARTRRNHRFAADKDPAMLERAVHASLTLTPDRRARFEITNDRVGHFLPSGGNWLSVQLKAYDLAGNELSEQHEVFGKEEALIFDFWPFNEDRRIPFGGRREILFPLPEAPGTVEAVVRYHDWMRTKRTILTLRESF